ncbi:MAG: YihY/virulence factor BrkB family protein [Dehalococcoidia bacterium]
MRLQEISSAAMQAWERWVERHPRVARTLSVLKATWDKFNADKAPRTAAALAYFTIFSLAPLLMIAIGIAGFFVGDALAQDQVYRQIEQAAGDEVADFIMNLLEPMTHGTNNLLVTLIGIGTVLWGAMGIFGQIRDALNQIWKAPAREGLNIIAIVRDHLLALALVILVGALLFLMVVASTAVAKLPEWVGSDLAIGGWLVWLAEYPASFLITTLLFAAIFRWIPDQKLPPRDVAIGSVATALLFTIGRVVLTLYLAHVAPGSAYGAAGALVVLLVWIQYSAQIFLLGAEFTYVWAVRFHSPATSRAFGLVAGDGSGEDNSADAITTADNRHPQQSPHR